MLYLVIALCYAAVAYSEWPCKSPSKLGAKIHAGRHLVECLIATIYLLISAGHFEVLERYLEGLHVA